MLSYPRIAHREGQGTKIPLKPTLDNQGWTGNDFLERAEYIEALSFSGVGLSDPEDYALSSRHGELTGPEILEWVYQRGKHCPLGTKDEQIKGGVRLLFVERSLYQPPSYDIGKPTYLAIAEQFNLPEEAVHALSNLCGVSTYSLDVDEINETPQSLRMVIKASQKFQVGNYGLAFSHDFATGISCGILHGTGVTTYGKDYDLWEKPPVLEIFEHIKNTHHLWSQPMFLATILLQHHFLRTDYFCTIILANKFTDLQFQMGTSRAGRLNGVPAPNLAAQMSVPQAKVSLRAMTVAMSSLMFDINWFCSVSDWECTCLKQIAEVHAEVEGFIGRSRAFRLMREKIQYLLASAESIKLHNNRMREAGQTDMSILYSIISQVDNRLNAKIAAASSQDSAAMKTLAFLTTLFLPGTFVATIFSTGMFDWKNGSSQSDSGRVVSELFWVYWAFTIPLTALVGVGWRLWWSWTRKHFDRDIDAAVEAADGGEEVPNVRSQLGSDGPKINYWEGLRHRRRRNNSY